MLIFKVVSVSKCLEMRDYIIMEKGISYYNQRRNNPNACFLGIKGSIIGL